jgi:ATP-dependent Clp protease protease subunit
MIQMISPSDHIGQFNNYAMKHMGISGMDLYDWEQTQNRIYSNNMVPEASMTPYILEERELRATQIDIFSRLLRDRILWLAGVVNDRMSTVVQAQLLYLDDVDPNTDILMYVDSPGGSVKSGLSIVDSMDLARPDIRTVNTGMAASMGSVLLGAGTKGKRASLKRSKVMLHQISYGASGNYQDIEISRAEAKKTNEELFKMLGEYCDKTPEQVLDDSKRDFWMNATEAIEYGIIDEIVVAKPKD